MTKKSHQKFWRMKIGKFLGKSKIGTNFHGVRTKFSEIGGGNLKQRGNASLPQWGMDSPGRCTTVRLHYMFVLDLSYLI